MDSEEQRIQQALAEDIGAGDVTTEFFIPADSRSSGRIFAKEPCIVSGLTVAQRVFAAVDTSVQVTLRCSDGDRLEAGQTVLDLSGPTRGILTAERTALNFLQYLSGIATATRSYVEAVAGTHARILDTRKTLPGWRALAKKAVADGGGTNHRMGLYDRVLVKDNHLAAAGLGADAEAVRALVADIRRRQPGLAIQFEADTLDQVAVFAASGADFILLDNMPPAVLCQAVALVAGRCRTEASGGITLETIRSVAETGVDFISVGALTHSVRAVDLSLEIFTA